MGRKQFSEQELLKRGIDDKWICAAPTEEPPLDGEMWEAEDELEEAVSVKSPERISKEQQFREKYQAYLRPETPLSTWKERYLLEDLIGLLRDLNMGWVYRKCQLYRKQFPDVDEEAPLQVGCIHAYNSLAAHKAEGRYIDNALAYYLKTARNGALDDYFRKEFGRYVRKKSDDGEDIMVWRPARGRLPTVSLESGSGDADDTYREERDARLAVAAFDVTQRPQAERDFCTRRLCRIYLRELMNYPAEPQKPLAVMFASYLFQLAKNEPNEDEFSLWAKNSTALSSVEWAFARMGEMTLERLGDYSQQAVQFWYGPTLFWGDGFRERLQEKTEDGAALKWAHIIYTRTYTKKQTTDWVESVGRSTIQKAARIVAADPQLREYAMESMGTRNKFKKELQKRLEGCV